MVPRCLKATQFAKRARLLASCPLYQLVVSKPQYSLMQVVTHMKASKSMDCIT